MMIASIISLFQKVNIEEKMQNAPNKQYEIGVVIGTYLPFIVLIIIAYTTYFYFKRKEKNKTE
ncbi:hypothetical protein [Flavobacterium sp.]|uniref:hypothetical protein n=1 Tax=Flavobacterium sp. TaxID=239 RepID=UPI003528CED6